MQPESINRIRRLGGLVIRGPALHPSLAVYPLHPATTRAIAISLHEDEKSIHMSLTAAEAAELVAKLEGLISPTD